VGFNISIGLSSTAQTAAKGSLYLVQEEAEHKAELGVRACARTTILEDSLNFPRFAPLRGSDKYVLNRTTYYGATTN
jgi:hypothetical protein